MRAVAVSVLAVVTLLPGAIALDGSHVLDVDVHASPVEVTWTTQSEWRDVRARDLRTHLDVEFGNRDGYTKGDEAAEWLRWRRATPMFETKACRSIFDWIRVDGRPAVEVLGIGTRFEGLDALAISLEPVRQYDTWTLRFAPATPAAANLTLAWADVLDSTRDTACYEPRSGGLYLYACCGYYWGQQALSVRPTEGFVLPRDGVRPAEFNAFTHERGWRVSAHDREAAERVPLQYTLVAQGDGDPPAVSDAAAPPRAIAPASWVWLALSASLAGSTYAARGTWLRLFAAIGFTRLAPDDVRDHPLRHDLLELIRLRPGICPAELERATRVSRGRLSHHLRILMGHGMINRVASDYRTGFVLAGTKVTRPEPTDLERQVVDALAAAPGLSQWELMSRLAWTRHRASHFLRRLERSGRIHAQRAGREKRYRLA